MSDKYKFHNPNGVYFVTLTVNKWIDLFTRNDYKELLVDNLIYCQKNKGLEIYAWCIMTNHLHLMVARNGAFLLPDIMRDFKKYTSKSLFKFMSDTPQESRKAWLTELLSSPTGVSLWKRGNHPIELWSNHVIDQKLNYIHNKPVASGIVSKPEDYLYSSAIDYARRKGWIPMIFF